MGSLIKKMTGSDYIVRYLVLILCGARIAMKVMARANFAIVYVLE